MNHPRATLLVGGEGGHLGISLTRSMRALRNPYRSAELCAIPAILAYTWRDRTPSSPGTPIPPPPEASSSIAAVLIDMTTGGIGRERVDGVRCRRDNMRPAGLTRSCLQTLPTAT